MEFNHPEVCEQLTRVWRETLTQDRGGSIKSCPLTSKHDLRCVHVQKRINKIKIFNCRFEKLYIKESVLLCKYKTRNTKIRISFWLPIRSTCKKLKSFFSFWIWLFNWGKLSECSKTECPSIPHMRHIQITSPLHSSNVLGRTQDRNDPETCKLGGWSLHGKHSEKRGARREEMEWNLLRQGKASLPGAGKGSTR